MPKLTEKQTEKYSRQIIIEKSGMSGQKKKNPRDLVHDR